MTPIDFLRAVLPADGYYAVVGIKNKKVKQTLIGSLDEASAIIRAALKNEEDVYFGCSSYATGANRTIDNVLHARSFWVDLDCGAGTAYETKELGFAAVQRIQAELELPVPFIVDSGRGLHIYWTFEEPIKLDEWKQYATKLVELLSAAGLSIKDKGCSTDAARILRVPNTLNFKNPEDPLPTKLLWIGYIEPWERLKQTIDNKSAEYGVVIKAPVAAKKKTPLDAVTAALMGNQISVFKTIARKSLKGEGCEQIRYAIENPAETPEPLWRAVLSVAQVCADRDVAIHKISRGHPGYNARETEEKANGTGGPYTCAAFSTAGGVARCGTCSFGGGRIIGPIALGKEIAKAEPSDEPMMLSFTNEDGQKVDTSVAVETIQIPDLPFPYFRGKNGGIYREAPKAKEGEETGDDILVYKNGLDLVRRIKDPEKGEVLVILHSRPKDGMEEIVMPLADAQSMDRMKDKLGYHGVAAHKEQMNMIGAYLTSAVRLSQEHGAAEPARSQMGWTEDRKGIVWGRTLFMADGPHYCPPASKSTTVAGIMKSSGSFAVWEEIAERYAEPGFELYAMCVLMAFGSMLNNYTYEDPVWVHMVSSESGTGKTTLTNVINSIWGDPLAMKLTVKDTVNALEKRRVVFNSMAICQDEITNLPPEKLSELAYAQSQGREKLRLSSASTEISNSDRRNNTLFTNGNRHIADVLSAFKTNAAGEYARLIEVPFQPLGEKATGDRHFGKVLSNYGHAGPVYAQWLVKHEKKLDARVTAERERFEHAFQSESSERNWVALTATAFAAGRILQNELQMLRKYDLDRLYAVWLTHMQRVRKATAQSIVTHETVLGDFINDNYSNILIPDSAANAAAAASPQTASLYGKKTERESRNKLVIRWEKDTRKLYIAQSELKLYCAKRSHSFVDLLGYFSKNQQFAGIVMKRMGAGTDVITSPINVLSFHVTGELGYILEEKENG